MTDLSKLVRPLVWQEGFAETPFGTLSVDIRSDSSWRGGKEYRAGDYVQNAQADEEADYTARILAALEPAAPDLSDPVTVHANMLRGTIAKPTVEQIIHLYGVDALAKALAPVIVREAGHEPS